MGQVGRSTILDDPMAQREIDNIYRLIQLGQTEAKNLDIPSVAQAIAQAIQDGQLGVLNRVLEGRVTGNRLILANTLDPKIPDGYALYVAKINQPASVLQAVYLASDLTLCPTVEINKTSAGNGVPLHITNAGADRTIDTSSGAFLTNGGHWQDASSRDKKTNFRVVLAVKALQLLAQMDIKEWCYKDEKGHATDERHLGPVAEDFHEAFGLGDSKTIAPGDLAGVALLAIQGLLAKIEGLEGRLRRIEDSHGNLDTRPQ